MLANPICREPLFSDLINCPTTIGFLCTIKLFWQFRRLIYNYMTTLTAVCLAAVERIAPVVAGPFTDLYYSILRFSQMPRIILAMSIFDISSRFRYYRFRRGSVKQCLGYCRAMVRYMDPFLMLEAVTVYGYGLPLSAWEIHLGMNFSLCW